MFLFNLEVHIMINIMNSKVRILTILCFFTGKTIIFSANLTRFNLLVNVRLIWLIVSLLECFDPCISKRFWEFFGIISL